MPSSHLTLYRYGAEWSTRAPGIENHATQPDETATFRRVGVPAYDSSEPCAVCGWHDSDGGCNCG